MYRSPLRFPTTDALIAMRYRTSLSPFASFLLACAIVGCQAARRQAMGLTTLHVFPSLSGGIFGTNDEGALPNALVQSKEGDFYGMTSSGGTSGNGTMFKLTAGGDFTVLHPFAKTDPEGAVLSQDSLIQAHDGNFYGITEAGGLGGDGTVFKITPGGKVTVLCAFHPENHVDGVFPHGPLVETADGSLYGVTNKGGKHNGERSIR